MINQPIHAVLLPLRHPHFSPLLGGEEEKIVKRVHPRLFPLHGSLRIKNFRASTEAFFDTEKVRGNSGFKNITLEVKCARGKRLCLFKNF